VFFKSTNNPAAALAALDERHAALAQQRHTAAAAYAVAQQQELEALVDGGAVEVGASTRHAQEVELLDRALATLQGERGQFVLAVEVQKARKLRERAQQLREEAAALLEKARPLLAKLGEMFNVANHPNITGVSTTAYNMSSNSNVQTPCTNPAGGTFGAVTGQTQIECSVMTYVPLTNNAGGSGLFNQQSGFGSATNANSNFAYSVRQVMLTMRIEW